MTTESGLLLTLGDASTGELRLQCPGYLIDFMQSRPKTGFRNLFDLVRDAQVTHVGWAGFTRKGDVPYVITLRHDAPISHGDFAIDADMFRRSTSFNAFLAFMRTNRRVRVSVSYHMDLVYTTDATIHFARE